MSGTDNDEVRLDDTLAKALEQMACELESQGSIDLDAYRVIYPQHATRIAELVPTLRALHVAMASDAEKPGDAETRLPWGVLGDFRLIREVGRGGMGIVYEAEQIPLRRRVAVKVLPWAGMWDDRHLQRFKNEAAAAAQLDHPHIVQVYSVASERGVHYYSMRFVDGVTIADVIRGQRDSGASPDGVLATSSLSGADTASACAAAISTVVSHSARRRFQRIAELGRQAAEALAHAHQAGIIHRDIKPSNLLLDTAGKLYVTDFGLAKMDDSATLTTMGFAPGTLRYMSPEQLDGSSLLDGRTDVYSLGVTLYEILTGEAAFPGDNRKSIVASIQAGSFTPIHRLARDVPRDLETIVLNAMSVDASDRFATAATMAEDLQRFFEGTPIRSRRASVFEKMTRLSRRNAPALLLTTASLLLITVVTSLAGVGIWHARGETEGALRLAENRLGEVQKQRSIAEKLRQGHDAVQYAEDVRMASSLIGQREFDLAETILRRYEPRGRKPEERPELSLLRSQIYRPLRSVAIKGRLYDVALSPDETRVATASDDGVVRLWHLPELSLEAELTGHAGDVNSVVFLKQGEYLASGGDDSTLRLWDIRSRRQIDEANLQEGEVHFCALDDDCVIGQTTAWEQFVWSAGTRSFVRRGPLTRDYPQKAAINSQDASVLSVHASGAVMRSRPLVSETLEQVLAPSFRAYGIAQTPNCKWFATIGEDAVLRIWETVAVQQVASLPLDIGQVDSMRFSPDNATIAVTTIPGNLGVYHWDENSRSVVKICASAPSAQRMEQASFCKDGRIIAIDHGGSLMLFPPPKVFSTYLPAVVGKELVQMDLSEEGQLLAVGDTLGTVEIWNLQSNVLVRKMECPGEVGALSFILGGRQLSAAVNGVAIIYWDVASGKETGRYATEGSHWSLAPGGKHALHHSFPDDRPYLLKLANGTGSEKQVPVRCAFPIRFSPDGKHFASHDRDLSIVNVETANVEILRSNVAGWHVFAVTNNGNTIVTERDGGFAVYCRDEASSRDFAMFGDRINCLAVSPDESRIATLSEGGIVSLWDVRTTRELVRVTVPRPFNRGRIRFCNSGRRLICTFSTGKALGTNVYMWDF